MPTYQTESSQPQLPKADYKVYALAVPEGHDGKGLLVDFKSKPVGWLYKNAKGGIYGTLRLKDSSGKELRFKVYLSENNYQPAAVAAPSHEPLTNGKEDSCPF